MAISDEDRRLAELMRGQHGVASRRQARELGVPLSTVDGRLQSGRYQRVLPGVFSEGASVLGWRSRARAAVLWADGDAVLARGSAAHLHGLPAPVGPIHLLVGSRTFRTPPGVVVHRSRSLPDTHVVRRDGIPATSVARTVCDLAGDLTGRDLRRLVAAAVRDDLTDAIALRDALCVVGRVPGVGRLRDLVAELSPLDGRCRSVLESDFLDLVRRHGLEPTAMNHRVRDRAGGTRYLDAVWLPERQPVELDSTRYHSTALDVADDRRRVDLLTGSDGWRPSLRFTWADVQHDGGRVVDRIRDRLDRIRRHGLVC